MAERGTQQNFWDDVAAPRWEAYDSPLIPNAQEIDFQRQLLVPGGDTLVLGATRELCQMAVEESSSVTAVDFSIGVINKLRTDGVEYVHKDWSGFLDETEQRFDNIMTDGGLLCIEFPTEWNELAKGIHNHLRPGGIFAARVYVSQPESPAETVQDPNGGQFVKQNAQEANNWMVTPTHEDYTNYDVRYAKPPRERVLEVFSTRTGFGLFAEIVPDYKGGENFPSFAWQRIEN